MSETPPTKFVRYPREHWVATYGTNEKLESLYEGYCGLNQIAGVNAMLLTGLAFLVWAGGKTFTDTTILLIGGLFGMYWLMRQVTLPAMMRIAEGMDWPESRAKEIPSIIGLTSCVLSGVVASLIFEQMLRKEMKRYGVRAGVRSIKIEEVQAALELRLREEELPVFMSEI